MTQKPQKVNSADLISADKSSLKSSDEYLQIAQRSVPNYADTNVDSHSGSVTVFSGHKPEVKRFFMMPWSGILGALNNPQVRSSKTGAAGLIFGEVKEKRANGNILSLSALVVDIDNGQSIDDVRAILTNIEHPSLLSTTHSHGKNKDRVPFAKFQKWRKKKTEEPTVEEAQQYMASINKGYVDVVAVKYVDRLRKLPENGNLAPVAMKNREFLDIYYEPLDKMRIVIPLHTPFTFSDDPDIHASEVQFWKLIYKAVCEKLGFKYDASCADPARFYYYPSHALGAPHVNETFNVDAPFLDLDDYHAFTLDDVKGRRKSSTKQRDGSKKKRPSSFVGKNGGSAKFEYEGFDLVRWAAKYAATIHPIEALENRDPTLLLRSPAFNGEGVHLTKCAFIHEHDSPQGTKTAIKDGDGEEGFVITCLGEGCQKHNDGNGRDRLAYIVKMLEDGWLTLDDLQNPEYGGGLISQSFTDNRSKLYWRSDAFSSAGEVKILLEERMLSNPSMFKYLDAYARVVTNANTGSLQIEKLTIGGLGMELNSLVTWHRKDEDSEKQVDFPKPVQQQLFNDPHLPLPVLRGVKTTPFFDANGRLVIKPGYDRQSGVMYNPPEDLRVPQVSASPSAEEVLKAKGLLGEQYEGFPFHDDPSHDGASYAHMLALTLQPFARELIDGPTPIFFVQKTTPGTGASLINEIRNILCYGFSIGAMAIPKTDEELSKKIDAALIAMSPVVWFDNVEEKIDNETFALATTTGTHSARILGKSETVDVPVRCDWIMSGNNVGVGKQFVRRVMLVNLDAQSVDPTKGRTFKHPDLREWVKSNRSELIWACLTLIQAWIAKGKPLGSEKIASYESWSTIMGGLFDVIGVDGLFKNLDAVAESVDDTEQQLPAFFAYWWDQWGDKEVIIGRLANDEPDGYTGLTGKDKTVLELYNKVAGEIELGFGAFQKKAWQREMGKLLAKANGRHFVVRSNKEAEHFEVRLERRRTSGGMKYRLIRM
ncbi:MAG: hypothetical protein L3J67_07435 [Hyphomicrobiaceae bacterium]|nr:hypothetical protein [Hyphomicrobiaceae bacterium]